MVRFLKASAHGIFYRSVMILPWKDGSVGKPLGPHTYGPECWSPVPTLKSDATS